MGFIARLIARFRRPRLTSGKVPAPAPWPPPPAPPPAAAGTHTHRCGACGYVWRHGDENAGIRTAHLCPRCGGGPWWTRGA